MGQSLNFQKAIHDTLREVPAIMDLVNGVYDRVPPTCWAEPKGAFISFGPSDYVDDGGDCIDGFLHTLQIDIWSREVGYPKCKQIADLVRRALHLKDVELAEGYMPVMRVDSVRFMRDPDGLTSHGVVTVSAYIDEDRDD